MRWMRPKRCSSRLGFQGRIVVDHEVSALEVDALAGGIGGEQDLDRDVMEEALLGLAAVLAPHPAVDDRHGLAAPEQLVGDVVIEVAQSVAVLGKDDDLLARRRLGQDNLARIEGCSRLGGPGRNTGGHQNMLKELGQL